MVTVRVEQEDVLDRETDVLVLKYAQELHGVDRQASYRLGGFPERPAAGESFRLQRPTGLGATSLVVLGVQPLDRFGYAEIREFGRRAVLETRGLDAREVCLTVHGPGSGLDEAEAFRAELAGIHEVLDAGGHDATLEYVTVVDRNHSRAERLRSVLADAEQKRASGQDATSAGRRSDHLPHAFVAMPFDAEFEDHFLFGIQKPVHDAGLLCRRMDKERFTGDIVKTMEERIRSARVVVADLTTGNPNVHLEVGYAWAAGCRMVLLCHEDSRPVFDIQGHRHLRYRYIHDMERELRKELAALGFRG